MIAHDTGSLKRISVVLLNAASFGASAYAAVMMSLSILRIFCLVTLGPFGPQTPFKLVSCLEPSWTLKAIVAGVITSALVLLLASDHATGVAWSFRSMLLPLPALAFLAVAATSYRLLGLLLCGLCIVLLGFYVSGLVRVRSVVTAAVLLGAVSLAPVDISLQDVPGPPRIVRAGGGLMGADAMRAVEQGDLVIVSGCFSLYYEPMWVIVW